MTVLVEPETLATALPLSASGRPEAILPHQLPHVLDHFPDARVLSLDCFDTLIWRDTHAPTDIFARLPGTTPMQRRWAESQARKLAGIALGRQEVSIAEIYAQLLVNAPPAERAAAITAEIDAEARHCFAFAPTVELIRRAKARGMQVIIVSDTYLDAGQLAGLVTRAAGPEVAGMIDRFFVSSAFGKPKAGGLYGEVLRKLSARPDQILHIGDNKGADVDGVAPFGVHTLHLMQFSGMVERQLRLEAAASAMIHRQDIAEAAAQQPHRPALALTEPQAANPAARFGLSVLGPVMAGFHRWLAAEAESLNAARGGTVHWLFLMRDGFLPMAVHGLLASEDQLAHCHPLEISRFTATAASFATDKDVLRYAQQEFGMLPQALARQLLLSEADIARLTEGRSVADASRAVLAEIRKEPRRKAIVKASRGMAQRLIAHIRATCAPAPGDTLMLVDLGYNGSVQNRIDALIARELKVHVAGRYLLLREMDRPGLDKRGFLSSEHYDPHTLEALCANVAVLEQLSTTPMGSVIDYTQDGAPIRRENDIKQQQSAVREAVQEGTLAFVSAARAVTIRAEAPHDIALWRMGVAAVLARVMYLPTDEELAVIARFEHDVNLGTDRKVALFDPVVAQAGLRQRGLFYLKGAERMYLPAELKGQGMTTSLALLATKRFGLPLGFGDFSDRSLALSVIFAAGDDATIQSIPASATHEGYYLAAIPIGDCRYTLAVQLGQDFEWVELESVNAMAVADFLSDEPEAAERQIPLEPECEGIERISGRLLRCTQASGFLLIPPPERHSDEPMLVALAFRPLVPRTDTAQ